MSGMVAEGWSRRAAYESELQTDLKEYSLLPSSTFRIGARFEKRPLGSCHGIAVLFLGPVDLRA